MKNFLLNQKGMILVVAFSVMTILFFLSTIYLWMMDIERDISVNHRNSTQALYLAEAGLQYSIKAYYDDYTWRETAGLAMSLEPGSYIITCEDHPTVPYGTIITSTGLAGQARRSIKTDLSRSGVDMVYALLAATNIYRNTASGTITGKVHANGRVYLNYPSPPGTVNITDTVTQGGLGDDLIDMPQIDMQLYNDNATLTYTGNRTFTCYDNDLISNDIVYVAANPGVDTGLVTIHGVVGGPKGGHVRFDNCVIAAEGGFILNGTKNIVMSNKTGWPLLVTETGNIIDPDSTVAGQRSLTGVVSSEQGRAEFRYIQLKGALSADSIDLITSIDITYVGKWMNEEPSGYVGPGATSNWREAY